MSEVTNAVSTEEITNTLVGDELKKKKRSSSRTLRRKSESVKDNGAVSDEEDAADDPADPSAMEEPVENVHEDIGATLLVRNGLVTSKDPNTKATHTASPEEDDPNDEPPQSNDPSTDASINPAEAWMKEYGGFAQWPQEYREMYAASAAAAGYGDLARQWSAWGAHPAYQYPFPQHPQFAAQFGQAAGYYGQYGAEGWQQYQQAALAHQMQQAASGSNRARKRTSKSADGEDEDGDGKKTRKTRANFSKDVIALLTTWILTNYDNPYPQKDVKEKMQEQTGLTELQLDNWFSNARRRLLTKDETTKRYTISTKAPKKRGPKSKERDSDFDDA